MIGSEMKEIREKWFGVNNRIFARILGWGGVTMQRYENGISNFNHSAEVLLKLLDKNPSIIYHFYEVTKNSFTEQEQAYIERKLDEKELPKPLTSTRHKTREEIKLMAAKLTASAILEYEEKGYSDRQIAKEAEIDRTWVSSLRKKYGLLQNRNTEMWRQRRKDILENIEKELRSRFSDKLEVVNDPKYSFLVNGNKVKIVTANVDDYGFSKFSLTESKSTGISAKDRLLLPNGLYKTLYEKRCDFVIFVQKADTYQNYWIIPSEVLDKKCLQTIALRSEGEKFAQYEDAWLLLE